MPRQLYQRFLPLLHPYRGRLALAFLATLAGPALGAARIWLLKVLVDGLIGGPQPSLLLGVCIGYVLIALARGLASFGDDYLGGSVGARVVRDLRSLLYAHLQDLSLRFFHRQRLGDLLTRLTGDISAIEDLLVSGLTDVVAQSLTVLVFLGMLFYLSPLLALISLIALPALAVSSGAYAQRTRSAQVVIRESASTLTSVAEEGLSAIALVKAFAREPFERERFGDALNAGLQARLRSVRLRAVFTPVIDILATLGLALVVWFGAQAVWSGALSPGGLVAFLGYLGALYAPIQALSRLGGAVQRAHVAAERVAEVLDADPALLERRHATALPEVRGRVEFRNVTFGYSPEDPVLRGFDLTIVPGETVALVGASGAGKTTVVSLLLGYYDADGGVVAIDGRDIRQFDPVSVRGQIAAVLQEPMLFQASVRENLRYGRLDATDAEIEVAAEVVQADAFIRRLPDGYETPVGPRGARLSGGQRQRLAIARALLKGARVMVLDEATSALDPHTEASVLEGLRARLAGTAVLVVAHRLSTVRQADRIVVLDEGRVAECGTHTELLASNGLYHRFYAAQLGPVGADQSAPSAAWIR
ncbi:MAG: ABC transporter ATP-binding protein/permease [Chloroflexota bacterium]|nr:ABC transporter ATP-binding protein/permease [Chloroflexota bacterium]